MTDPGSMLAGAEADPGFTPFGALYAHHRKDYDLAHGSGPQSPDFAIDNGKLRFAGEDIGKQLRHLRFGSFLHDRHPHAFAVASESPETRDPT